MEDEDFPKTIILGNPEKNSKIKVQWADDSFRVGSGFGVQPSTKFVSLLDNQSSSTETLSKPSTKQFSLPEKQNLLPKTENEKSDENSPKKTESATNETYQEQYDQMFNVTPNQNLGSEKAETECPGQSVEVKPANLSTQWRNVNEDKEENGNHSCSRKKEDVCNRVQKDKSSNQTVNRNEEENGNHSCSRKEEDVCNRVQKDKSSNQTVNRNDVTGSNSSVDSENNFSVRVDKTRSWMSILQKPSSTFLPGNSSTTTSNDIFDPAATSNEKVQENSPVIDSDTKLMDRLDKNKSWMSILKKPSKAFLVANSPTSTNDRCSPAATVNEVNQTLPALCLDENLESLVILTNKNHNKCISMPKKQIEECLSYKSKNDSSVERLVSMASATERKIAEEKKVYSVSLLNQTSLTTTYNKKSSQFQKTLKPVNDFAAKQSVSKHGKSHKTLVSLLNGRTFSMPEPFEEAQGEYSLMPEMCIKSPSVDGNNVKKRKSKQCDTSLDESFEKEYSLSEANKRIKTDRPHGAKSDDSESFNAFNDFKSGNAHMDGEKNWDIAIKKEACDSDFHTFDSDINKGPDTENSSGTEAPMDFFIKQEAHDPEYGDQPSVSTNNVKNPKSTISKMNIPIKEEISNLQDGHFFNENDSDSKVPEDRNISFIKQEVFDPGYEDTPPVLSLNASSMPEEATDPEHDDIPPVLSPKKEVGDSDFEEWNEELEDSPPVLQKESNLSKEDASQKIPKKFTKSRIRKQLNPCEKSVINNELMCPICKAVFQKTEDFDVHKALHSGQQILSAKQYPEKFVIKPAMTGYDGNRKFKCEFCGKAFNRPSNLKEHVRIHTGMYPHKCQLCDKGFHTRTRFLAHMARHDEENEAKDALDIVQKDNKEDSKSEELGVQGVSDVKFRKYVCNICNEIFDKVTQYRIHRLEHRGEIPHTCKACGKVFPCKSDLMRHEATHSDLRPYECYICDKAFKRRNALVDHLTIHRREKSNQSGENASVDSIMKTLEPSIDSIVRSLEPDLNLLGKSPPEIEKKSESNSPEMERPLYTNNGQKMVSSKFYCKECKISFSARREYSMHRFQHNGGHPHVCGVCNKMYAYKSDYDRHVATHSGRKPYVCHLCNSEFSRKYYLQKHLSKHKNTRISLAGKLRQGKEFEIEIDNPEKSSSEASDCEDNGDIDLRSTAGKLETSYDEDGAMFLFVTDD